ncbi:Riboflavin transporter RfnT [Paenibacillus solanacearum]|uniref:Riboflavin transporter RfnT n=1 Tax=Paenibacillus solanacearum TaxID=2048548 RepID=A0A916JWK4_9BACL|nr:MFS transporter [Paenibacillus solanacearum]CAG7609493.1 Riboflavin transporter RfnT [Paenibacillus solanacearum]
MSIQTASAKEKTHISRESWRDYADSPEKQRQLYKRTMIIVIASQMFGGAGLAAGITVGALLAQDMLGKDSYTGLPTALFTLGSAAAALIVGRLSQRLGRRTGLAAGFLAGGLGAVGVVLASVFHNIALLCVSLLVYGAGTATNLQARYAGTDLALPTKRAKAISIAMVFTTFGAVAGPNLVTITGRLAASMGAPALSGPFMLAAAAYILAGLVLLIFLRPDPLIVAKAIAEVEHINDRQKKEQQRDTLEASVNKRGIIVGASVMVLTQIVMIAIMTMTPVHMKHHGHGLGEVGVVIGIHVAAMYLPSLLTGVLVDKYGRLPMSYASGVTLLLAGLLAAFAPGESMVLLVLALALLGLGWNFGLISGTAAIVDATPPQIRAKTQGTVDVLIALSGASGGALSGMVVAQSSYSILSLSGGFLSLLLIPIVLWFRRKG